MDKIQIDKEKNNHNMIPLGLNNNSTKQRIMKV